MTRRESPLGVISSEEEVGDEDLKSKAQSWKIEGHDLLKVTPSHSFLSHTLKFFRK